MPAADSDRDLQMRSAVSLPGSKWGGPVTERECPEKDRASYLG